MRFERKTCSHSKKKQKTLISTFSGGFLLMLKPSRPDKARSRPLAVCDFVVLAKPQPSASYLQPTFGRAAAVDPAGGSMCEYRKHQLNNVKPVFSATLCSFWGFSFLFVETKTQHMRTLNFPDTNAPS